MDKIFKISFSNIVFVCQADDWLWLVLWLHCDYREWKSNLFESGSTYTADAAKKHSYPAEL